AISRARWESSKAQTESAVLTYRVPSRPIRAGHALRAMASPTAAGQRPAISPRRPCAPKRDSSPRIESDSRSTADRHDLRRLGGQGGGMSGRDHDLAEAGKRLRK